jgi:hypothetical protein
MRLAISERLPILPFGKAFNQINDYWGTQRRKASGFAFQRRSHYEYDQLDQALDVAPNKLAAEI